MLKYKGARKKYGAFEMICDMEIKPGMVTGLIGANGAGKSTAFKAALGLLTLDGGVIELFGKSPDKLTAADKERLGVVLAEAGFSEYFTIMDIAAILEKMYHHFCREEFLQKCEMCSLPLHKKIKEFSTGMKAKLKFLAALSHRADLLILDEPTAGLDVAVREEMLSMLQDYLAECETRSVFISSHISTDLEQICDDVYMIQDGRILLHEETDVIRDSYGILKVDEAQYERLDKCALLRQQRGAYGFELLTSSRQFYSENYPELVIEKCSMDAVILLMMKGDMVCQDC